MLNRTLILSTLIQALACFYIDSSWASACDGAHSADELSPFSFDIRTSEIDCDTQGRITHIYTQSNHEEVAYFTYAEGTSSYHHQYLQVKTSNFIARSFWDFDVNGFALLQTTIFADQTFMWHTAYNDIGALEMQEYPSGLSLKFHYSSSLVEPNILIELGTELSQFISSESKNFSAILKKTGLPDSLLRNDLAAYLTETTIERTESELKSEIEDLLKNHKTLPLYLPGNNRQYPALIHLGSFNNVLSITDPEGQALVEFLYRDQTVIGIVIPATLAQANTTPSHYSIAGMTVAISESTGNAPDKKSARSITGFEEGVATNPSSYHRSTMTIIEHPASTSTPIISRKFASEDRDHDGLLDTWEILYFSGLHRDGSGDFDQDGLTDKEEHQHNSNPRLKIDGARRHTNITQLNVLIHHL